MPLDSYARSLASQLTGRERWSAASGPEGYAGRQPVELFCDLMFKSQDLIHKPLVAIENRPFKTKVGLDPERRFFSATEIVSCGGIQSVLQEYAAARQADPGAQPNRDQRLALDIQGAIERVSSLSSGQPLPLVPAGPGKTFLRAGTGSADPGAEGVQAAITALGRAYVAGQSMDAAVDQLRTAIAAAGQADPASDRAVSLELFYNKHHPWRMAAYGYGLAIVLFGLSTLAMRRWLLIAAILAGLWGVAEHVLGVGLRVAILGRAPVSNTYEAILWMGLIGVALGAVGQIINRKAWYLFAGLGVALLSVIFSTLVPLESRTNSLPAVLRSNYWLIVHVLTITASYGVLAVASLLGHVYLVKEVLLRRGSAPADAPSKFSNPLVVQTYRSIQIGLFLLTAGTILGGVWAADSWGRFWGWDPKETWALISIVVYFAVLHARYVRWIEDFGLAACAVLGFASIVWTFYGVNYLMASGLHSYGFGAGGGTWVGVWAVAEILFVVVCRLRRPPVTTAHDRAAPVPSPAPGAGQTA